MTYPPPSKVVSGGWLEHPNLTTKKSWLYQFVYPEFCYPKRIKPKNKFFPYESLLRRGQPYANWTDPSHKGPLRRARDKVPLLKEGLHCKATRATVLVLALRTPQCRATLLVFLLSWKASARATLLVLAQPHLFCLPLRDARQTLSVCGG